MDAQRLSPANPGPIHVHFVLLEGSLILDWAGPAEALRMANQRLRDAGQPCAFQLHFIGPAPTAISSVGAAISAIAPLPAALPAHSWLVLVGEPGATIAIDSAESQTLLHWLRGLRLQTAQLELITVCAGAVIAGHAGLLHGHKATTHHHHLDELRRVAR
ncbi:MAG: AraC family transcriptional regulator, partial [Hydrogenophaga sp.]